MSSEPTPEDVLTSTTPQVRNLVAEILKIEREYQHIRDLSVGRGDKENKLCEQITRLIEREIKQ